MEPNEVVHERESEPESTVASRYGAVGLAKAIEDIGKKLRFDALTVVAHGDLGLRCPHSKPHANPSARWRELDRVREEVPEDLLEPLGVACNHSGVLEVELERDVLAQHGANRFHCRFDDRTNLDGLNVQPV